MLARLRFAVELVGHVGDAVFHDWDALTREHGLVDDGRAREQNHVARQRSAFWHFDHVPRHQLRTVNLLYGLVGAQSLNMAGELGHLTDLVVVLNGFYYGENYRASRHKKDAARVVVVLVPNPEGNRRNLKDVERVEDLAYCNLEDGCFRHPDVARTKPQHAQLSESIV